ncbi:MAG: SDR family oxidoreductase [Cyclobacteriaceae bacterium]|jgi:putative NADH-flavin reductase|nr:SDR family oxidoreductase [Bacteroidota bacterium]|tara:strand:+ start:1658 stop:2317 length:660 start_codon:yes stop_codon:yes gene_type:complete
MKTIAVLGANGRTGIEIVKQALEKGWVVKALVRDKQKIKLANPNLHVVEGNPMRIDEVTKVVEETDAVYVALNIGRKTDMPWSKVVSPLDLLRVSIDNTINAMQENGVKRVITVSAWGTGDSYKETNWIFKFLIKKTNVGVAYAGHEDQERLLRKSGLDWTSVRPVGLSNSEKQKSVRVSIKGDKKLNMTISRKDVARFMLDIVDDEKYYQQEPSISSE